MSMRRTAVETPLNTRRFLVAPGERVDLGSLPTLPPFASRDKTVLRKMLESHVSRFAELQEAMYAESRQALLLVFQGMDASGKDSTIKHVTTGVNPQGFRISNFSQPTNKDIEYSYLHRHWMTLPERGRIGIFNRSHYEEVVTLRVNPELLAGRRLPPRPVDDGFWDERLRDIVAFERHLVRNGTTIIKFFLHISKKEQKARLLERLSDPTKHWKFNPADLEARARWDDYTHAYESAFEATSTQQAPWYVIPGDSKPAMRVVVAAIIVETLAGMKPRYPEPGPEMSRAIKAARKVLS